MEALETGARSVRIAAPGRAVGRIVNGARGGNRTPDLTLTKRLLYQLSYTGNRAENYTVRSQSRQRSRCRTRLYRVAGDGQASFTTSRS